MTKSLKVVYMAGGADYTILPLNEILKSSHKLIHVYTKQPKPVGRGKRIIPSTLQKFLEENKLPYSMPKDLKSKEVINNIKKMKPDLILVFSFGHILSQDVLNIPKLGCLNIHASILPKWRGPSPVQYAILNNDKETGYSIMIMNKEIDEGEVLYSDSLAIQESDNTLSLLYKITSLACNSIIEVINKYSEGKLSSINQNNKNVSYSYIIKKNETYLDFNEDADIILQKIKAYNPNPGAKCFVNGELIKIIEAKKEILYDNKEPGIILDENFLISCKNNAIRPIVLQRAGKKPLKLAEALNGWKVFPGHLVKNKKE